MVVSKKKNACMRISKASLRVGIDARLYQEKGLGRYIRNLIKHLQEIDKENEYFIFLLKKDFEKKLLLIIILQRLSQIFGGIQQKSR